MSTLRDIRSLYGPDRSPFYAGFGNRFTDQISYRTVDVPRTRIFTINSNAEVSLDLLSLNKMKLSYVNMSEVVDHYFPPVDTLVKGGGEDFTDFKYWRDNPLELDEFSASDTEGEDDGHDDDNDSQYAEEDDEEVGEGLGDSYISRDSADDYGEGSAMGESYDEEQMMRSMAEDEYADDEEEELGEEDQEEDVAGEQEEEEEEAEEDEEGLDRESTPIPVGNSGLEMQGRATHDLSAELITGVKNLKVDNR
jgi:phosphatidate phosphatase LPIN